MGVFATQQQQQRQQQQREVSDTVFSTDLIDSVHGGVLGRKRECHAKRADEDDEEAVVTMTTTEAAVTVTASPTSTTSSSSLPTAPGSALPFPTTTNSTSSDGSSSVAVVAPLPFDTTLSFNLSSSCVNFFAEVMQDDRVVNGFNDDGGCLGFGLMMRTSSGWNSM
jgi:hypothetical protein